MIKIKQSQISISPMYVMIKSKQSVILLFILSWTCTQKKYITANTHSALWRYSGNHFRIFKCIKTVWQLPCLLQSYPSYMCIYTYGNMCGSCLLAVRAMLSLLFTFYPPSSPNLWLCCNIVSVKFDSQQFMRILMRCASIWLVSTR
jgi:hypothetical protein